MRPITMEEKIDVAGGRADKTLNFEPSLIADLYTWSWRNGGRCLDTPPGFSVYSPRRIGYRLSWSLWQPTPIVTGDCVSYPIRILLPAGCLSEITGQTNKRINWEIKLIDKLLNRDFTNVWLIDIWKYDRDLVFFVATLISLDRFNGNLFSDPQNFIAVMFL